MLAHPSRADLPARRKCHGAVGLGRTVPGTPPGTVALADRDGGGEAVVVKRRWSCPPSQMGLSAFAGFRFPPEVIELGVRRYLRFGLSYRDLEELLA